MITVIVLNYKRPDLTLNCIKSLAIVNSSINVIVVDNDIENPSLKNKVQKLGFYYISTNSNIGYAKGNNYGVHWANDNNLLGKYLCILNNDTIIIEKDFFKKLIKELRKKKNFGLIGPMVINAYNGKRQGPFLKLFFFFEIFKLIMPFLIFFKKFIEKLIYESVKTKKTYRLIGAALFFKSDVFLEINGFDENTFLGAEEEIVAEKLKLRNYITLYTPNTRLFHYDGSTKKKTLSFKSDINHNLNGLKYYYKYYRGYSKFQIKILVIIFNIEKKIKSKLMFFSK